MSYDLDFWKYKPGASSDHQAVYERLSDGERLDDLEDLPIESIRSEIAAAFTDGWARLDPNTWEGESSSFQLFTTPQFVRIDCYSVDGNDMNRLIEILHEHRCPLYDPQVGQRYDGA